MTPNCKPICYFDLFRSRREVSDDRVSQTVEELQEGVRRRAAGILRRGFTRSHRISQLPRSGQF
jgi:hypothetical protein